MKKFNLAMAGIITSLILMLFAIPYTIYSYLDTSIPFDDELLFFSGVSVVLFVINLYYYKRRRN